MTSLIVSLALGLIAAIVFAAAQAGLGVLTQQEVKHFQASQRKAEQRLAHLATYSARSGAIAGFIRVFAEAVFLVSLTLILVRWLNSSVWGQIIAVTAGTLVSYFVVRVLSRAWGRRYPKSAVALTSSMLTLLLRLTIRFTSNPDALVVRSESYGLNDDQIRDLMVRLSQSAQLEAIEQGIIDSVFDFSETPVRELMVPRTDMVLLRSTETAEQAIEVFAKSGFSRIPVIDLELDDVVGVLYFKDLVQRVYGADSEARKYSQMSVMRFARDANFVPETKKAQDLFEQMRREQYHISIVVDEYGGVAGLVTIEDLLEELVGELVDEHDTSVIENSQLADGSFRVSVRTTLSELSELLERDITDEDIDTVGGLLGKALGKVPLIGSEAEIYGLHMVADSVAGRRRQVSSIVVSDVGVHSEDEQ